jgi:hypothetical protein
MYVLSIVCFYDCWFCQVLFHLFVVKFILVSFFFKIYVVAIILVKNSRLVIAMDDLDFGI